MSQHTGPATHHSLHHQAPRPEVYNDNVLNTDMSSIPEPLYRLRVSVLKDGEGSADMPVRMFIFPSQPSLKSAVEKLGGVFGGAFSEYKISQSGGALDPVHDSSTKPKFLSNSAAKEAEHAYARANTSTRGEDGDANAALASIAHEYANRNTSTRGQNGNIFTGTPTHPLAQVSTRGVGELNSNEHEHTNANTSTRGQNGNLIHHPDAHTTTNTSTRGQIGDLAVNDNLGEEMFSASGGTRIATTNTAIIESFGKSANEMTEGTNDVLSEGVGLEDGRTEDIQICFDSQTADESWHEFLGRMDQVKQGWGEEGMEYRTLRGEGVGEERDNGKGAGGVWRGEE